MPPTEVSRKPDCDEEEAVGGEEPAAPEDGDEAFANAADAAEANAAADDKPMTADGMSVAVMMNWLDDPDAQPERRTARATPCC